MSLSWRTQPLFFVLGNGYIQSETESGTGIYRAKVLDFGGILQKV